MNVLKFGGTSVGSATRMRDVARIVESHSPVMIVLSAVSGTTNKLVDIAYHYNEGKKEKALSLIDELEQSYFPFVEDLLQTESARQEGKNIIATHFAHLRDYARNGFGIKQYREILAQGELISTQLFYRYMVEQYKNVVLINALDFMRVDEDGEPEMHFSQEALHAILAQVPGKQFYITQGFICRNPVGEIENLKRGGSDYSASLIGAALGSEEIQIWTDIDGMHNNDPRIVQGTYPVRNLSFDEAAELAYFGAKILHPSSVNPARKAGIPVRLKNTMQPEAEGTLISEQSERGTIKAIAAKDGITAIRIVSNRMLLAFGFLRNVFEIFERYKTPIDMITTSEVAVSLTIDNEGQLENILKELSVIADVEVDRDLSIISVVGDHISEGPGLAGKIFGALRSISMRMVSGGGSPNNVSLLLPTKHKNEALRQLNVELFQSVSQQC